MIEKIREALNKEHDQWKQSQLNESKRLDFLSRQQKMKYGSGILEIVPIDRSVIENITKVINNIEELMALTDDELIDRCKVTKYGIVITGIHLDGIHINL